MNFWETVVETNTFNFAILLLIFVILYSKLNVSQMIENIKINICKSIENAEVQKNEADKKLKDAENMSAGLGNYISEQLKNAQKQADGVSEQIMSNAQKQTDAIVKNADKLMLFEEKNISTQITADTLKKASQLAEKQIIDILKSNRELQDKLIEESIREI